MEKNIWNNVWTVFVIRHCQEIEIICVDDGSTDSSWDILNRYKDQDDRIQLYRQQNLYAGVARNTGKSHATGEYLVFWDCDDFFEPDALAKNVW